MDEKFPEDFDDVMRRSLPPEWEDALASAYENLDPSSHFRLFGITQSMLDAAHSRTTYQLKLVFGTEPGTESLSQD